MMQQHIERIGSTAHELGLRFEDTAFPRVCQPEETAELIVFLASPGGSSVSGSSVLADGGMLSTLGF